MQVSSTETWFGHALLRLAENFILVSGINARNAEKSNAPDATRFQSLPPKDFVLIARN